MPVRIRLARHGRKKRPFYHIVVADGRKPRDGKYIERIGSFDPTTKPATKELDFDKALYWVQKGAQASDTCRAILSESGVMMKKHLLEGVRKGAFDEAEAEKRYAAWKTEKEQKLLAEKDSFTKEEDDEKKQRLEAETKVNQERAEALAKKLAEEAKEENAEEEGEEAKAEDSTDNTDETKEEAKEEVAEEKTAEDPAKEEAQKETKEDTAEDAEEKKAEKSEDNSPKDAADEEKESAK